MLRQFFGIVFLVLVLAGSAFAQTQPVVTGEPSQPPLPKPLTEQRNAGAIPYYLGRFEGLDGWVMVREGQPEFYYSSPNGKAVVMGFLFDENGTLLTGEQLKSIDMGQKEGIAKIVDPKAGEVPPLEAPESAHGSANPVTPETAAQAAQPAQKGGAGEMLFAELQSAAGMTLGSPDKPTFYAFIDPNCPHCQHFLREMEPLASTGRLAVRIIPVGYDDKSMAQSAYALALADGAQRFANYAKGDATALEPPANIPTDAIQNNRKIMKNWRFDATPIIVYRAFGTGEIKIIRGRPLDPAAVVKDLTGQ